LFLLTVLEELRVFGVHEELDRRLETLLSPPPSKAKGEAPTVDDVFEHVLSRVEGDVGRPAVQRSMEALWASRAGLFQDELLAIARVAPAQWAEVRSALDESLYEDSGRLRFGHDYLRKAVEDRYGLTDRKQRRLHRQLAEYFAGLPLEARVAEELPWQWEQARETEKLRRCLTDRVMFEALMARGEHELLGYWVRMGSDIHAEYEAAWRRWRLRGRRRVEVAHGLAGFLLAAGCYTPFAVRLLRCCLAHGESVLGVEHPETLGCVNNLGDLLHKRGDDPGAEVLFRRALEGFEKVFGPRHPETLGCVNNLGVLLKGRGDHAGAEVLFRRVLAGDEGVSTQDPSGLLDAVNNLGNLLYQKGDWTESGILYRRAWTGFERLLGPGHPRTLMASNNLAGVLSARGDLQGAENLYRRVLAGYEGCLGREHPFTLSTLHNLAVVLGEKGDKSGAETLHRRALAGRVKVLGLGHPDTLMSAADLNAVLGQGSGHEATAGSAPAASGAERTPLDNDPRQAVDRILRWVGGDEQSPCAPGTTGVEGVESLPGSDERGLLRQKLGRVLGSLTGRERQVFEMRFGLVDGQARTLEEVGRKLKAPPTRLRQIEAKALRKLRHPTRLRLLRSL
jgi:tetratricopeptide (TPR) repeat protein